MKKKRVLLLILPYLGIISWQTRTKLQKALKGVLNCCKQEIVFKCQTKLFNSFSYKDPIRKDLISGGVNFSGVSAMSPIMVKATDT